MQQGAAPQAASGWCLGYLRRGVCLYRRPPIFVSVVPVFFLLPAFGGGPLWEECFL